MSISVNGQSQVPPGFRFHPTEEELLQYYLRKKVSYEKIDLDVIRDVDLNKLEPWDIQENCKIGSTPQNDWYFFSHKDKKYPTGTRTNRATAAGFWKATGRDKVIYDNSLRIGMRKTLVFYKGRAPHGQKSDWIMHEYRLDDINSTSNADVEATKVCNVTNANGEPVLEEGWVVCRIFKKKNHQKTHVNTTLICGGGSSISIRGQRVSSRREERALDHTLLIHQYTEKQSGCNVVVNPLHNRFQTPADVDIGRFMRLPDLESPNSSGTTQVQPMDSLLLRLRDNDASISNSPVTVTHESGLINDLDRLVASHAISNSNVNHISNHQEPPPNWMLETGFGIGCPIDQTLHLRSSHKAYPVPVDAPEYHTGCELWAFAQTS